MYDVLVGRQPIFDRSLNIAAFELLFRSGTSGEARVVDGNEATSQVLLGALFEIGLDQMIGAQPAFINFTRDFLTSESRLPLEKERVVVELLEDIEPDDEVLAALERIREAGYRVALDDFELNDKTRRLLNVADIVKLDLRTRNREQLRKVTCDLRNAGIPTLLAEKVETRDEYDYCRDLGFDLFQGYFLCRPETVRGRAVAPNRTVALQLLARLRDPEAGIPQLEAIVGRDPSMSVKILNYINSSSVGVRRKVESIRKAISFLGIKPLRMMATLILFSGFDDKPRTLVTTALVRASMCEFVGRALRRTDTDSLYTVGLFSTLDALMNQTMDEVVGKLPLCEEVKNALQRFEGIPGELLKCVQSVERDTWGVQPFQTLPVAEINKAYIAAIKAANDAERMMSAFRETPQATAAVG